VTIHSYQDSGHDVLQRVGGPVPPWDRPTVRDVMRATGTTGKPLWLTETGWSTANVSEDQQASYVDQVLEGFQSAGIAKVFVYQLVDEPYPEWHGILHQDLSPKPAYEAYQLRIAAQPALTLSLNQRTFRSGDTLRVGLREQNPGAPVNADFYFGVLLPDGVTVLFVTNLSAFIGVVTRLDADPRTFRPLLANVQLPHGLDTTLIDFFVYTFAGGEPAGTYAAFTFFTPPGAFNDGRIDAGDLPVIDV
jgi:hypothetical protein